MIKYHYTEKELQKFGWIFLGYFLFFNFLISHLHHHYFFWSPTPALLLLLFFIFLFPQGLIPFKFLFDTLLTCLRWLNTRILFGMIFFCIFSPIALFRRMKKKDILHLAYDPKSVSYRMPITSYDNDLRRPY